MAVETVIISYRADKITEGVRPNGKKYKLSTGAEISITYDVRSGALAPKLDSVRLFFNNGRKIAGQMLNFDSIDFEVFKEFHRFGAIDNMRESSESKIMKQVEKHKEILKKASESSNEIMLLLTQHYTQAVFRTFPTVSDFLDDINEIAPMAGFGKDMFIKYIITTYYDKEGNFKPETVGKNPS